MQFMIKDFIIIFQMAVTISKSLMRKLGVAAAMQLLIMRILCLRCVLNTKFEFYAYMYFTCISEAASFFCKFGRCTCTGKKLKVFDITIVTKLDHLSE